MHVLAVASATLLFASAQDPSPSPAAAWSEPPAEHASAVPEAPAAPAAPAVKPDLAPRFVGTVADLSPLAVDPVIRGRIESLEGRRMGGVMCLVGAGVGSAVGSVLAVYEGSSAGAIVRATSDPSCWGGNAPSRCTRSDYTGALVAFGVSAALAVTGVLILPRRHDVADVARLWNARHPDQPVETWPEASPPAPAEVAREGDGSPSP